MGWVSVIPLILPGRLNAGLERRRVSSGRNDLFSCAGTKIDAVSGCDYSAGYNGRLIAGPRGSFVDFRGE